MTDEIFFDSDCISAFLWVDNQSLLARMYPGNIVIPETVYNELCNPNTPHLKERVDSMIDAGEAVLMSIEAGTDEYRQYAKLTGFPDEGFRAIDNGEAATIVLAKTHNGVVASNNLRDIQQYIDAYALKHTTTADILVEAYKRKIITREKANQCWREMRRKRRRIGANTFDEYLSSHPIEE